MPDSLGLNRTRIKAFLTILRPSNGAMMGSAVLIGQFITLQTLPDASLMFLGFTVAFTLTSASMILNDYYDAKVDAVNQPHRPIPRGVIKPKEALAYTIILSTLGLAAAMLTNALALLITAVFFIMAASYNSYIKKRGFIGNLVVSFTVAAPFLYGSFSLGIMPGGLLILFAFMAFMVNTGREVVKGISDVKGDALREIKTIALTHGEKAAARVGASFYLAAIAISPLPLAFNIISWLYIPLVVLADVGFAQVAVRILTTSSAQVALKVKKESLIWMLFGLIAFLVGGSGRV